MSNLLLVDRWGIEQQKPKINGHNRLRAVEMRPIKARYDLAQTDNENANHWAAADDYDADSANSKAVRQIMRRRSRYEDGNNGYVAGIARTHATFVVRKGPKLRFVNADEEEATENVADYEEIKRDWRRWCKAIQFRRKLRCMCIAKVRDGEPFAIIKNNPNVKHDVKLDLKLIEAEQCQTPMLPYSEENYIDGIKFDDFGNPISYDILKQHPGATGIHKDLVPESVPAKYVLHWFDLERPGQHRGIPAMHATLGLGAIGRRWRGANLGAAESAAQYKIVLKTQQLPVGSDPDALVGLDDFEQTRAGGLVLPMGWDATQMNAAYPQNTYDSFNRSQISELARPLCMPYMEAAADSSNESFSGHKVGHMSYFLVIDDVDREDCNDMVMDPLFNVWWEEYILVRHARGEMLEFDPDEPHEHKWDWERNPVADMAQETGANAERIRTGQAAPSDIAHENGQSFEQVLIKFARDFGTTVDDMRSRFLDATVAPKSGGVLPGYEQGSEQPQAASSSFFQRKYGQKPPQDDRLDRIEQVVARLADVVASMSIKA